MVNAALIEQSARALLDACPPGSKVILFGSRARGSMRPDSDVDFMVVEPRVISRVAEAARLARVLRPLRVPADILVIGHDDYEQWKDAPSTVFYAASREGKVFA